MCFFFFFFFFKFLVTGRQWAWIPPIVDSQYRTRDYIVTEILETAISAGSGNLEMWWGLAKCWGAGVARGSDA